MKNEISRGAEAVIFLQDNEIIKERVQKKYRYFKLDVKLRISRTKRELNLLKKSSEIINVPKFFGNGETEIFMEYIKGEKLSNLVDEMSVNDVNKYFLTIGEFLGKLHNKDIIHNDLTTSNIILLEKGLTEKRKEDKIYFIDFGLGFISNKIEDKSYDLHILRNTLKSRHFTKHEKAFSRVIEGYKTISNDFKLIEERLKKIEERGRYKKKMLKEDL